MTTKHRSLINRLIHRRRPHRRTKQRLSPRAVAWCAVSSAAGYLFAMWQQHHQPSWAMVLVAAMVGAGTVLLALTQRAPRRRRSTRGRARAATMGGTKQGRVVQARGVPELRQGELEQDHAEWERRVNGVLYGDEGEVEAPDYNVLPAVSVAEHREQLRQSLSSAK